MPDVFWPTPRSEQIYSTVIGTTYDDWRFFVLRFAWKCRLNIELQAQKWVDGASVVLFPLELLPEIITWIKSVDTAWRNGSIVLRGWEISWQNVLLPCPLVERSFLWNFVTDYFARHASYSADGRKDIQSTIVIYINNFNVDIVSVF